MAMDTTMPRSIDDAPGLGRRLHNRGFALELLSIVSGIFLFVVGLVVAGRSSHDAVGNSTHPYVAIGVAICVAALLVFAFAWTIAQVVGHLADYVEAPQL